MIRHVPTHRFTAPLTLLLTAILFAGCAAQQPTMGAGQGVGALTATSTPTLSPIETATATTATTVASPTAAQPTARPTATRATTSPSSSTGSGAAATSGAYSFPLLAPGATLPSEAFCASHVARSSWEPRPDNQAANMRVPTSAQIAALSPWDASIGLDPRADQLRRQVTGNYTGTTDEILQWVACKWGVPADVVRAQAVVESYWHQSQQGDWSTTQSDCPPGTWNGSGCYQSYGLLQIKYKYFASAWPMSRDDTAFSAEYMYGQIRICYEGWTTYLSQRTPLPGYPTYHAGDLWGCLGRWYSGGWYDQGAVNYISKVKAAYDQKVWRSAGF